MNPKFNPSLQGLAKNIHGFLPKSIYRWGVKCTEYDRFRYLSRSGRAGGRSYEYMLLSSSVSLKSTDSQQCSKTRSMSILNILLHTEDLSSNSHGRIHVLEIREGNLWKYSCSIPYVNMTEEELCISLHFNWKREKILNYTALWIFCSIKQCKIWLKWTIFKFLSPTAGMQRRHQLKSNLNILTEHYIFWFLCPKVHGSLYYGMRFLG